MLVFGCKRCGQERSYGQAVPIRFNEQALIGCGRCRAVRWHTFLRRGWPKNGRQQQKEVPAGVRRTAKPRSNVEAASRAELDKQAEWVESLEAELLSVAGVPGRSADSG